MYLKYNTKEKIDFDKEEKNTDKNKVFTDKFIHNFV